MLKKKIVKGFIWVGLSSCLVQGIKLISKIVLARLLLPEDFGLVSVGLFVLSGFALLQGLGINTALVRKQEKVEDAANAAFILAPCIGGTLFILTFLASAPAASFFQKQEIANIVRVLSFTFILSSFELVPSALLTKNMAFARGSVAEVCSTFIYAFVAISLAYMGKGYWSLIYGYISSLATSVLLMWLLCDFRPSLRFNREVALELLSYGKFAAISAVASFFIIQLDNGVVGKVLGMSALGWYGMAYTIANLPVVGTSMVIAGAMYPVFSKLQSEKERLRQAVLKSLKIIAVIILPISFCIIVLSDEFIRLFLGAKWLPMSAALKILCIFAVFRAVQNLLGMMLQAIGEAKIEMLNGILEVLIILITIVPLTWRFNIIGTSIAVTIMIFLGCSWLLYITAKKLYIKYLSFFDVCALPVFGSVAMSAILILIKKYLLKDINILSFFILVLIGGAVFLSILIFFDRKIISEGKTLFNLAMSRNAN